ncbi:hypothetical protein T265_03179, partial [Opisthorchis viverrini]
GKSCETYGRTSNSVERYPYDIQYLTLLQFVRTCNLPLHQGDQSDDHCLPTVHYRGREADLGFAKVSYRCAV